MTIALQSRPSPVHPYCGVVIAGVFIHIGVAVGTVAVPDRAATGVLGRLGSLPAGIIWTGATLRVGTTLVKIVAPAVPIQGSKEGGSLPSTSEISERASPVSPGRRRPKRSRKIGKRHCEFRKGLFVNRPPMSFSRSSAGMRRRTLIGTGPLRAAPQTHEPVENPDSTLKDCLLDPGNFLAGLGN